MSKVNDTTWRDMITALRTLPKPVITTPKGGAAKMTKSGSLNDVRPSFRDNKYILASLKQSKGTPSGAISNVTPNSRMPSGGMFTDLFNQNLSVNQKYDRYLAHIDTDDLEQGTHQPESVISRKDAATSKKDAATSKKDIADTFDSKTKHSQDFNSVTKSVRSNSGTKSQKKLTSERSRDSLIGEDSYENLQNSSLEFRHRMSPGSRNQQRVTFKEELQYKFLNEEGSVKSKPRHLTSPERDQASSLTSDKTGDAKAVHFKTELEKMPGSR